MAEVPLRQGRLELAQATLEDCRSICVERNLGSVQVEILSVQAELLAAAGHFEQAYEMHQVFHAQFVALNSTRREADARTRQALFETAEARHSAERFWRQARTDALTGLPNRRFADEEVPRLLSEVAAGTPLVAAIVDADHFKRINDTLSHEVGIGSFASSPACSSRPSRRPRIAPRARLGWLPASAARSSLYCCPGSTCPARPGSCARSAARSPRTSGAR